jgi:hypothetical protein
VRDRKGHKRPQLIISTNSIQKWEKCPDCGQTKRRGDPWLRPCTGPVVPKAHYMGQP